MLSNRMGQNGVQVLSGLASLRRQLPLSVGACTSGPSPIPSPSSTKASGSLLAGGASVGTSMSASRSAAVMSVPVPGCSLMHHGLPTLHLSSRVGPGTVTPSHAC